MGLYLGDILLLRVPIIVNDIVHFVRVLTCLTYFSWLLKDQLSILTHLYGFKENKQM